MLSAIVPLERSEDRLFLDNLYQTHYAVLLKLASNIILDNAQAKDIVNNAMLSLFSKVPFLRSLSETERIAYMKTAVRNAALKHYNGQRRKNLTEYVSMDSLLFSIPGPDVDDPAQVLQKSEEYRMLRAAIAELPDQDRQILFLKYSVGLTSKEIAEITAVPNENAVNVRISRARHKILLLLQNWGWENG